jgi:hypothetical protein
VDFTQYLDQSDDFFRILLGQRRQCDRDHRETARQWMPCARTPKCTGSREGGIAETYAPNREQLIKRRIRDSELPRHRIGDPERVAYGSAEIERLDIGVILTISGRDLSSTETVEKHVHLSG